MATATSPSFTSLTPPPLPFPPPTAFGAPMRQLFSFHPSWTNLNQGSFGTYPTILSTLLQHYQRISESAPDVFVKYLAPQLLQSSRRALAPILHLSEEKALAEVVFVQNATTGVNTVLRGMTWETGDVILVFNFVYGACGFAVDYVAATTAVEKVVVEVQLPATAETIITRFREMVREVEGSGGENGRRRRVRLALFDTIVSMPGYRLPFEELVKTCKELGVLSLVDAAHGVGHIDLDLEELGADFLTSNLHKWLFLPRGNAILHIPARNQHLINSTLPTSWSHPSLTSHFTSGQTSAIVPWATHFDDIGTIDSATRLCIPAAITFRSQVCGGESAIQQYSIEIAHRGAALLAQKLGTEVMPQLTGECALVNIRLPLELSELPGARDGKDGGDGRVYNRGKMGGGKEKVGWWIQEMMGMPDRRERLGVDTDGTRGRGWGFPVMLYYDRWWARVSGMIYLEEGDFEVAELVKKLCGKVREGAHLE